MELPIEFRLSRFNICKSLKENIQEYVDSHEIPTKLEELYPKIIEQFKELEKLEATVPIEGLCAYIDNEETNFFKLWNIYIGSIQKSPYMCPSPLMVPFLGTKFTIFHQKLLADV